MTSPFAGVMWALFVLGVILLLLFAYMNYRAWRLKKALKLRLKRDPVPFCGTNRVPGLTLAEVRRAREADTTLEPGNTHVPVTLKVPPGP